MQDANNPLKFFADLKILAKNFRKKEFFLKRRSTYSDPENNFFSSELSKFNSEIELISPLRLDLSSLNMFRIQSTNDSIVESKVQYLEFRNWTNLNRTEIICLVRDESVNENQLICILNQIEHLAWNRILNPKSSIMEEPFCDCRIKFPALLRIDSELCILNNLCSIINPIGGDDGERYIQTVDYTGSDFRRFHEILSRIQEEYLFTFYNLNKSIKDIYVKLN